MANRRDAIPFELFRGSRIILDGAVNGTASAMMLDSGAGMTIVDHGVRQEARASPAEPQSRCAARLETSRDEIVGGVT